MTVQLYILTDSRGFTTCCRATMAALWTEACRVPLLVPVEVVRWQRDEHWKRVESWQWDGLPPTGTRP